MYFLCDIIYSHVVFSNCTYKITPANFIYRASFQQPRLALDEPKFSTKMSSVSVEASLKIHPHLSTWY